LEDTIDLLLLSKAAYFNAFFIPINLLSFLTKLEVYSLVLIFILFSFAVLLEATLPCSEWAIFLFISNFLLIKLNNRFFYSLNLTI